MVSSTFDWRRNEAHRPIAWSAMGWNRCERMIDVAASSSAATKERGPGQLKLELRVQS